MLCPYVRCLTNNCWEQNSGLPTFRTTGWNRIASFAGLGLRLGLGLGLWLGLVGLGLRLASQASRVYLRGAKGGETPKFCFYSRLKSGDISTAFNFGCREHCDWVLWCCSGLWVFQRELLCRPAAAWRARLSGTRVVAEAYDGSLGTVCPPPSITRNCRHRRERMSGTFCFSLWLRYVYKNHNITVSSGRFQLFSVVSFIAFAKEVTFYPAFVCLSVCLLAAYVNTTDWIYICEQRRTD